MKLYILRHGKSPSTSQAGVPSDFERPLAPEGRTDVRRTVAHLKSQDGKPALILNSPLRRAVETAGEASDILKPKGGSENFEPLSNELAPDELYPKLKEKAAGLEELLIVGHQPQLGELAAFLLGRAHPLMPGGIIALKTKEGAPVEFLWSCNPEDLPS